MFLGCSVHPPAPSGRCCAPPPHAAWEALGWEGARQGHGIGSCRSGQGSAVLGCIPKDCPCRQEVPWHCLQPPVPPPAKWLVEREVLGAEAGPSLHSLLQGPPHLLTQLLRHPEPPAWCRLIYLGSVACPLLAPWLRLALQELRGRVCPGPRHALQALGAVRTLRCHPLVSVRGGSPKSLPSDPGLAEI